MPKETKKTFKWTAEIEVSPTWVEDGFNLTADQLHTALVRDLLPYAYNREVRVKIIKAPPPEEIENAVRRHSGMTEKCEKAEATFEGSEIITNAAGKRIFRNLEIK